MTGSLASEYLAVAVEAARSAGEVSGDASFPFFFLFLRSLTGLFHIFIE